MSILPLRQDFVGGIAIIGVAAFALWHGKDLAMGTLGGMGPGMLPKSLAVLLGALGALLAVNALVDRGPRLGRISIRAPVFVLGAIAAFAVTVRPGGLLIAGPLAVAFFLSMIRLWHRDFQSGLGERDGDLGR